MQKYLKKNLNDVTMIYHNVASENQPLEFFKHHLIILNKDLMPWEMWSNSKILN